MPSTTIRLLLAAALSASVLLACSGNGGPRSDEEISLRREGLLDLTRPDAALYALKDPGESKTLPRAFYGAPPMIPHSVADQRVDLGTNDCLDCHEVADENTPGLPPSHRVKADFQVLPRERARHGLTTVFSGFGKATLVAGSRYDCLLCHVPQATNAQNLVENTFVPLEPKDAHKDVLDQLNEEGKF
jgi:nitrate reductase cytochrome c-type subunit